ncbi:MAG: hypothetical protein L6R42_005216, partial [Xanthoria sp. 1 TBL-2021]
MSTVESHASHKDAQFGQDNESDLTIFQFLSENTTEGLSKVISKTSELYNKYLEYKYLESEIKEEAKNQDKEWKRLRTLMD